jgi:tetratricopeptide (TPR) repeat protein
LGAGSRYHSGEPLSSQTAMKAQEEAQTFQELLAGQRWEDAIAMATTALARNPRDAGLYTSLAAAQMGARRPADALVAADNAALLAPSWEWSHRMRARALAALGRSDEALAAAEKADRIEEEKPQALDTLITQLLAQKRLAEAEATATELVRIDPEWAEAWNDRGAVLLRRKKFGRAESDFRTALSLAPNEAAYMNNIGLALNRRGKRKESIEWFTRAAQTNPRFATARTNAARSTRLYLWGGGLVLLLSILHIVVVGLHGGANSQVFDWIGAGLVLATGLTILLRYWLRKRSLSPAAQTIYQAESRPFWWRFRLSTIVRWGGLIVLFSAFLYCFLDLKDIRLTYVFVIAAVVWARGWEIWRFGGRLFQR